MPRIVDNFSLTPQSPLIVSIGLPENLAFSEVKNSKKGEPMYVRVLSLLLLLTSTSIQAESLINICDRGIVGDLIARKIDATCDSVSPSKMAEIEDMLFAYISQPLIIDDKSFAGLSSLSDLRIYDSNLSLLPTAFKGLNRLSRLTIDEGKLSLEALNNLSNLEKLSLSPSGDFVFKSKALNKMSKLKHVLVFLPSNDYDITFEADAFQGTVLESLRVSDGRLTLSDSAFDGVQLKALSLEFNKMKTLPIQILKKQSSLEYFGFHAQELESIPEDAFSANTKLRDLYLEQNEVRSFGPNHLANLKNLKSFSLTSNWNLTHIADSTFANNTSLEKLLLNETALESIDRRALGIPQSTEIFVNHTRVIDEDPTHDFVDLCHLESLANFFIRKYSARNCGKVSLNRILDTNYLQIYLEHYFISKLKTASFEHFGNLEEVDLHLGARDFEIEKDFLKNTPSLKRINLYLMKPLTISRSHLGIDQTVEIIGKPKRHLTILE